MHPDILHRPVAGGVDQAADRIAHRLHVRMAAIDHREVGLAAHFQPTDIVATDQPRRAGSGGVEDLLGCGAGEVAGHQPPGDHRHLHLVDEIMREGVGAEAERNARVHVAADMVQRDAAAPEHVRAMRHARTRGDQPAEVVGLRPVQPGVVVEEDAMGDDGALGQHAEIFQPLDRRHAVAAGHLVELDHALGCVNVHGDAAVHRLLVGGLDQLGGAGVDLRRAHHAGDPARGMGVGLVDDLDGPPHGALAGGLVPVVDDGMAVLGGPGGRAVHRAEHAADAGRRHVLDPAVAGHGQVAIGGHAALQHLVDGEAHGRAGALGQHAEDRHVFVERRLAELGRAQLLVQPLVARLRRRVGMHVDEAGHDHLAGTVQGHVGLAVEALAHMDQLVVAKGDVGALQVDMAAGTFGTALRIPGDHPVAILDHRRAAHGLPHS